ncbi:MAG: bifunctional DNA primase/polymerase [Actinomycetota bacterium]|nr:bifunctional DNA primase/polymerase [Actinomycetota bacterium]
MTGDKLLAAALTYAEHGWPVFPLRGKLPAKPKAKGGNGFHDATTDVEMVRSMWRSYPGANVGVRTGEAAGIAVLDVDGEKGIRSLTRIERERGVLPGTVVSMTGSDGLHMLYGWREGLGIGAGTFGVGLDLRGEGGYIVAPPSIHPDTGSRYRWAGNGDFAHELPPWPDAILPLPAAKAKTTVEGPFASPAATPRGSVRGRLLGVLTRVISERDTRNNLVHWGAVRIGEMFLAGELTDLEQATAALRDAALAAGLPDREVGDHTRGSIRSGLCTAGVMPR